MLDVLKLVYRDFRRVYKSVGCVVNSLGISEGIYKSVGCVVNSLGISEGIYKSVGCVGKRLQGFQQGWEFDHRFFDRINRIL